ncbi:MAG: thiamine-monophosphate kinase [Gammaproteobacteria bacterium]|jgi:thiamine-monophosphate kinase|nr:thiamine-monophosphate kinase [Gammaproteobacteria bacterium]
MTSEFNLIQQYFQSHPQTREDVVLGIGDDCALLSSPSDQQLAMSTDTLVEGVHYYPNADPHAIGHKALAVSLSDLAAMGATPAWVMLSLTLDQAKEEWIKAFCEGFFALLDQHHMTLIGGNMSSGPSSITTQVTGFLPKGSGMRRSGARPGDHIYVTGYLGDAALALAGLKGQVNLSEQLSIFQKALDYPVPRVKAGLNLRDVAHAAIDISDGLIADLGHILEQSGVGATIKLEHIPLSQAAQHLIASHQLTFEEVIQYALTGGDDYELCFTAPPSIVESLEIDCLCTRIGVIETAESFRLLLKGEAFQGGSRRGFEHFVRSY